MSECERESEQEGDEYSEEHLLWPKCVVSSMVRLDSVDQKSIQEMGYVRRYRVFAVSVRCMSGRQTMTTKKHGKRGARRSRHFKHKSKPNKKKVFSR